MPVSALLPDAGSGSVVEAPPRLVIDLERLGSVPAERAGPLARYASTIQSQRGDYNGKVLSIRQDDLRTLAVIYDMPPAMLAEEPHRLGRARPRRPPRRRRLGRRALAPRTHERPAPSRGRAVRRLRRWWRGQPRPRVRASGPAAPARRTAPRDHGRPRARAPSRVRRRGAGAAHRGRRGGRPEPASPLGLGHRTRDATAGATAPRAARRRRRRRPTASPRPASGRRPAA
nr:hypothetical protein [Angustibacter aerolatus]